MNNLLAVAPWLSTVFSVIVAILILLATITVHEFGHYIVGKLLKFKINEFAIGMGPAIYKKVKKNGEVFSIRIFPLGGFCAFEGEDEDDETVKKKNQKTQEVYEADYPDKKQEDKKPPEPKKLSENAFNNKKPWQRILVLIAGAAFNFVVAVIIVVISFVGYGHLALSTYEMAAPPSQTAETLSLKEGDALVKIDGKFLYFTTDMVSALDGKKQGDIVTVTVKRGGKIVEQQVSLRYDVNVDNMADANPCFKALGVASVLHVKGGEGTPLSDGAYIYRFKEDGKDYADSTRVYTAEDLYERLKLLNPNETLTVYIPDSKTGQRVEYTFTAPSNFNNVDLNNQTEVLKAFHIEETSLSYQLDSVSVKFGFFENVGRGVVYAFKSVPVTLQSFWELISGKLPVSNVSGPIGTITMTTQMVSMGFKYVLNIASLIGLSVAIFNLLPIPALDGARAVFVIIEWIRKKPINRNVEGIIHFVGLIVLVVFALLIDALKLFI
ncbi:MAG: site-2 protease family protein [Clostridia bacterium]|nr:site-2 protease family protein [Clostridia bacterium]